MRYYFLNFVLIGLTVLSVSGCDLLGGLGPARDNSRFISVIVDETKGDVIFAYSREVYRPATGLRAFPDGGVGKYTEDQEVLGIFNLKSKSTNVIKRFRNDHWISGSGDLHLVDLCKQMLFFRRGGQQKSVAGAGYQQKSIEYLLKLPGAKPTELELAVEAHRQGKVLRQTYLISGEGDLLIFLSPNQDKNTKTVEVVHRMANGEYKKILDVPSHISTYQGLVGSELFFWHPEDSPQRKNGEPRGTYWRYNLEQGSTQKVHWREFRDIQQSRKLRRNCKQATQASASISSNRQEVLFKSDKDSSAVALAINLDKLD